MSQHSETVRVVTLTAAGGATPTLRCWDNPHNDPTKNLTITLTTAGTITGAGNLEWEVFYGGNWQAGQPFVATSTHAGGVSQATGVIAGGTEISEVIHTDTGTFPANARTTIPKNPVPLQGGIAGKAVVVELTNTKAVPVTVYVVFDSESVSDII